MGLLDDGNKLEKLGDANKPDYTLHGDGTSFARPHAAYANGRT